MRLLFSDAFERGEIGLGPAGIVAADGVDDFSGESAEDARVKGSCESCGQGGVRRLGYAAGQRAGECSTAEACWVFANACQASCPEGGAVAVAWPMRRIMLDWMRD